MSEREILDLEDKRFGAMIKGDLKALDTMAHEQLLYTHSSGNTDTKASWLEFDEIGKGEVQEGELQRPQGAGLRRRGAHHRPRGDRG